ncbi:MAG: multidrug ABC transporter ATP-binding protein [Candidatus Thorarchaeota archaeon]|nr:MAG: multidrug ABC transporter ATP-binding protein [Candidatus Thorarchaeota archaeon]
MSESAITITNLTKRFDDVTAIENLSLDIGWGELFGVLGPNGAGKSTTVNILNTLLKPTDGSATVDGHDVVFDPEGVRDVIGVCPQEPAFYRFLTGEENIILMGEMHLVSRDVLNERVKTMVEKIGMEDHIKRRAKDYSGGMIRRVSMLMALVNDPKIALLDEPTVSMDPNSRRAVWDFIRELKARGKTVILTTHYMEEAQELCDRVAIIDEGHLIELGSPAELIEKHKAKNLEEVFLRLTGKELREVV